jgi:predicted amidophosphoribosyltransferase
LGEYTAKKGFLFSETNDLIFNFKIGVEHRNTNRWPHKGKAIKLIGEAFGVAIVNKEWLHTATLVPIPPSKQKNDPLYDDRVLRMLKAIPSERPLDIRELIVQEGEREAAHEADCRPRPEDLLGRYRINEAVAQPEPSTIGVFDDLLVTGASFKACQTLLQQRYPRAPVFGLFVARRVPETFDVEIFLKGIVPPPDA